MISVILVCVVTLGVSQANALVDQEPVAKDGYTKENSPTCFYGCSGYAPNYCEASWENCNPAFKGWKVKDFCKKSCYVPPVEDPCSPNPCQNNGVCVNGACYCKDGCTGDYCESCPGSCDPNPCENGGTCVNGDCQCKTGCSGTHCETCDKCNPNPCKNGATCNNGACQCKAGCSGKYCETCKPRWERGSGNPDCGQQDNPQYREQLTDYGAGCCSLDACKSKCENQGGCTDITWAPGNNHCKTFNGCNKAVAGPNTGWHHYYKNW